VKRTLNRVAVKLELSWQGLRDFDSISLVAEAKGVHVRSVAIRAIHGENCSRMLGGLVEIEIRRIRSSAGRMLRRASADVAVEVLEPGWFSAAT
jgi:hypothetical protein